MEQWKWIIPLIIIGLNIVCGLFRGARSQSIRLGTFVLSVVAAFAISCGIQAWSGNFQLSDYIAFPAQWGESLESLVIFNQNDTISNVLHKILFMDHCSVLVALIAFIITNKLGVLLYHMLNGIGRTTDVVIAGQGKRRFRLASGLTNIILGAVIGAVQGVLVMCLVYSPLIEIAVKLCRVV